MPCPKSRKQQMAAGAALARKSAGKRFQVRLILKGPP
jgi:hypothetical protein